MPKPNNKDLIFLKIGLQFTLLMQALIAKGNPWHNSFIEGSNRTDNEALFNKVQFTCEEDRRYQLRLWEMYYNRERPHQGLDMQTPYMVCQKQHFQRTSNLTLS